MVVPSWWRAGAAGVVGARGAARIDGGAVGAVRGRRIRSRAARRCRNTRSASTARVSRPARGLPGAGRRWTRRDTAASPPAAPVPRELPSAAGANGGEAALDGVLLRGGQRVRARHAFGQQLVDVAAQGRQRVFAVDGAQHVQRDDVAGAFPDREPRCVAHQARLGPFLDVAAAAAYSIASPVTLRASRQARNLISGVRMRASGVRAALVGLGQRCAVWNITRACSAQTVIWPAGGASAACVDQALAEGAALLREVDRLGDGAAHQAAARMPLDRRELLIMSAIC